MTIPVLKHQWQFSINQRTVWLGGSDNYNANVCERSFVYNLKNSMKGFVSGSWSVVGSSDGTLYGLDNVDRWTSASLATTCWIVLKQINLLDGNVQLLISRNNNTTYAWISPRVGFSGGNATTAPTASDMFGASFSANSNLQSQYNAYADNIVHVMQSTDGKHLRFFMTSAGTVYVFCMISEMQLNSLKHLMCVWTYNNNFTYDAFLASPDGGGNFCINTVSGTTYGQCITEAFGGGSTAYPLAKQWSGMANEVTNEFHLSRMGFVLDKYVQTISSRGFLGLVDDIYFGPQNVPLGTTYPVTSGSVGGADRLIQLSPVPIVLPWSGSIMHYA